MWQSILVKFQLFFWNDQPTDGAIFLWKTKKPAGQLQYQAYASKLLQTLTFKISKVYVMIVLILKSKKEQQFKIWLKRQKFMIFKCQFFLLKRLYILSSFFSTNFEIFVLFPCLLARKISRNLKIHGRSSILRTWTKILLNLNGHEYELEVTLHLVKSFENDSGHLSYIKWLT